MIIEPIMKSSLLKLTMRDYADNSGLHGVRYLSEGGRPWTERLWWTLAILGSVLGVGILILQAWQHWTHSPVLMSFSDKSSTIWDIPFPTVTICPPNKYRKKLFDMDKFWKGGKRSLSKEEIKYSDDLLLVCGNQKMFKDRVGYPLFTGLDTLRNIIHLAPTIFESVECANTMSTLNETRCDAMLDTIVTREGVCYTYNALPDKGLYRKVKARKQVWDLDNGYSNLAHILDLPRRATGAGYLQSVLLALKTNKSETDFNCQPHQGFKIMLTNPANIPMPMNRYYFAPMSGLIKMAVTPHVTKTENTLISYSPHQRHCYFSSERRLAYFSTYTQDNCKIECLTNYTLKVCRCVAFYMHSNDSTPLCAYGSSSCMSNAEQTLTKNLIDEKIYDKKSNFTCDCLPSCENIEFSAELSQIDLDSNKIQKFLRIDKNETYRNVSMNFLYIFLKDTEFRPLVRREMYSVASFIANCGGLLGFCCGFSLLSILEIIYFFTLRLWNNLERNENNTGLRIAVVPHRKAWMNMRY